MRPAYTCDELLRLLNSNPPIFLANTILETMGMKMPRERENESAWGLSILYRASEEFRKSDIYQTLNDSEVIDVIYSKLTARSHNDVLHILTCPFEEVPLLFSMHRWVHGVVGWRLEIGR